LNKDAGRLRNAIARRRSLKAERLEWQTRRLAVAHPGNRLRQLAQRLDELELRLRRAMAAGMERRRTRAEIAARTLNTVSPLATLERGYAIVTRVADGAILRDAGEVAPGEALAVRLARGSLQAEVTGPGPRDGAKE
jgi:exodeoxyribonuclease VII large subunit